MGLAPNKSRARLSSARNSSSCCGSAETAMATRYVGREGRTIHPRLAATEASIGAISTSQTPVLLAGGDFRSQGCAPAPAESDAGISLGPFVQFSAGLHPVGDRWSLAHGTVACQCRNHNAGRLSQSGPAADCQLGK